MNILEFQEGVAKYAVTQGDDLTDINIVGASVAGLVVDIGMIHIALDGSIAPGDEAEATTEIATAFARMTVRATLASEVLDHNGVAPRPDETLRQFPVEATCGHFGCGALELLTRITTLRVLASNQAFPEVHAHLIALTGALLNHVEPMLGLKPEEFLSRSTESMKGTS